MIVLGLGCNIGDRLTNLRQTLEHLRHVDGLQILQASPVYESDALLPENAPPEWDMPFLNLALRCSYKLSPDELLPHLKAIEVIMGRAEHLHWSPRIIDIDILAWDKEYIQTEKLHIPHRYLIERPFALWPLADVAPDWKYCAPNTAVTGHTAKTLVKKWGSRFAAEAPFHTKQIAHRIDTPLIAGILNITPDSFSDGGDFANAENALHRAQLLFQSGADIIDIGAESTRPKAKLLTPEEEWQRLYPILSAICDHWHKKNFKPKISVDTRHPDTAKKALQFPIDYINDVTGLTDPEMQELALHNNHIKFIFMHSLGIPPNQDNILDENKDAVEQVYLWAEKQIAKLIKIGIKKEQLIFDVGIGFGKSANQSLALIQNIERFFSLNIPLLVGHSRKSFLTLFTDKPANERDIETAAISAFLSKNNINYLRIHNVDTTIRLLKISAQLL